jgi:hypothetical protein
MFRHPLARDVALIVAIKFALIVAAAVFVFGPRQRPAIDAQATQEHLFDARVLPPNRSLQP